MTHEPTPPREGDDVDAAFADIISHWDDTPYERPAGSGLNPSLGGPAGSGETPAPPPPPPAVPPRLDRPDPIESGWRSYEPPADDEAFEPPERAPLPPLRADPWFWVSLVGMAGGGLGLLLVAILGSEDHERLTLLAGAALAIGFFVLVWRKSSHTEHEDREGWEDDSGAEL